MINPVAVLTSAPYPHGTDLPFSLDATAAMARAAVTDVDENVQLSTVKF